MSISLTLPNEGDVGWTGTISSAFQTIQTAVNTMNLATVLSVGNASGAFSPSINSGQGLGMIGASPGANQIIFGTGGGNVTHLQGPTDQPLLIAAGDGSNGKGAFVSLGNGGSSSGGQLSIQSGSAQFPSGGLAGSLQLGGAVSHGTDQSGNVTNVVTTIGTGLGVPGSIELTVDTINASSGTALHSTAVVGLIRGLQNSTSGTNDLWSLPATWSDQGVSSSGTDSTFHFQNTYNYSGAAKTSSNTDLQIDRIETALSTGAQRFLWCRAGSGGTTDKFVVDNAGRVDAVSHYAGTTGSVFGWTASATDPTAALDTGVSRVSAAVVAIGNGGAANATGSIKQASTTGSGSIAPTWTNFPGSVTGATNAYTWFKMVAQDGTTVYVPAFK